MATNRKPETSRVDINLIISIITLNVNGLDTTIKRQIVKVDYKARINYISSMRNPLHIQTQTKSKCSYKIYHVVEEKLQSQTGEKNKQLLGEENSGLLRGVPEELVL